MLCRLVARLAGKDVGGSDVMAADPTHRERQRPSAGCGAAARVRGLVAATLRAVSGQEALQ
jgi:hypothetical protein